MKYLIFFLLFSLIAGQASAQSSADWDKVASLYESEKSFQWVKKWQGLLHEVHDIEIVLASQNDLVKGWLLYVKSKDTLFLEGEFDGLNYKLLEFNRAGDFTGTILATVKGNELEGVYSNKRDVYSWSLVLSEQSGELNFSSIKNLFYLRQYKNLEVGSELELILTARNQNTISGIIYFLSSSKVYDCKGQKVNDYEYEIQLIDFTGKINGTAILSTIPGNQKLVFNSKNTSSKTIPISMYAESTLEWLKFSAYESMIEISFPKMENENFNRYVGNITSEWFQSLRELSKNKELQNSYEQSDWRNAVLASSWFEPYYMSKTLISGCFIMTNNRSSPKFTYIPVTFSMEKDKEIDIWDEIKNRKRLEEIILSERDKLLKTEDNEYNKLFNEWLINQDFTGLVITGGGLVAFAEYDIRFGLQKLFISTEIIKKELKSFSGLRKFLI